MQVIDRAASDRSVDHIARAEVSGKLHATIDVTGNAKVKATTEGALKHVELKQTPQMANAEE